MRVCVHPSKHIVGPRSPGRVACFVHVPSALVRRCQEGQSCCLQRPQASNSQPGSLDQAWLRGGCSRQRGAACQARRGDRRTKLPRDRERTLCHIVVITDSMWELSPVATHIIHVSQLRVSGFLRCSQSQRRRRVRGPTVLDFATRNHGANRERVPVMWCDKTMR